MPSVEALLADVPGFGACPTCRYRNSGPAALCYACAHRSLEPLAPPSARCQVCDRPLTADEACRNPLCNDSTRYFRRNFAIAMRSGALETALNDYKYHNVKGWAMIFGRVVAGFLEEHRHAFSEFDLILATPTFVGSAGRSFDHTDLVLQRAARELDPLPAWPVDLGPHRAVAKILPTPRLVGKSFTERRTIAQTDLRDALQVRDPSRTTNRRILVYDDVFTDGFTLNEVARALSMNGNAREVCGLSLCRQPWRGQRT